MKLFILVFAALLQVASAVSPAQIQAYLLSKGVTDPNAVINRGDVILSGTQLLKWDVAGVARPNPLDLVPEADAAAAVEAWRQASKPAERKLAENQYLQLCVQVLALASDPRAAQPLPPRLSFQELTSLLETGRQADPNAAVMLSVKLLSVNALLQRYGLLWWNDVAWHSELAQ